MPDKARYLLSYYKIRTHSRSCSGGFYFNTFCSAIGLLPRTARKHLKMLIHRGFIIDQGNDHYRIVSQKKITGNQNRALYFKLSDKELSGLSATAIVEWRAIVTELENERYKRHQRARAKGYSAINERDKTREKVSNPGSRKWDKLMSNSCSGTLVDCSPSTISKYRKRQNIAKYSSGLQFVDPMKTSIESFGKEATASDFLGKIFTYRGKLLFSPISRRVPDFALHRN
jgi:hypothetical protein